MTTLRLYQRLTTFSHCEGISFYEGITAASLHKGMTVIESVSQSFSQSVSHCEMMTTFSLYEGGDGLSQSVILI